MSQAVANLAMNAKQEAETATEAVNALRSIVADLQSRIQKLEEQRGQNGPLKLNR